MSIDLFCYTACDKNELRDSISEIKRKCKDYFLEKFFVSDPQDVNCINQEIALEYGLAAHAYFLIGVNDKNAANEVGEVAKLVKNAVGKDNVVILFENEKLI